MRGNLTQEAPPPPHTHTRASATQPHVLNSKTAISTAHTDAGTQTASCCPAPPPPKLQCLHSLQGSAQQTARHLLRAEQSLETCGASQTSICQTRLGHMNVHMRYSTPKQQHAQPGVTMALTMLPLGPPLGCPPPPGHHHITPDTSRCNKRHSTAATPHTSYSALAKFLNIAQASPQSLGNLCGA